MRSQKTGTVKHWFNGEDGYGYIHPDEGGEAVFVHHTGIAIQAGARSLPAGARVIYEVALRKTGGAWAEGVREAS